ncbi:MAG TPA: CDP-diacylglycerol--serine O-phosphatidyltransferase [Crenotrichaceae bacterium]|nr:CDP-diacylglycerol--serine O-phosphatidyltransferase [Crenotrichaceae bacterium]
MQQDEDSVEVTPRAESSNRARRRKGIYLLPNLLTTAALSCGFFAITSSINGRYESAAVAIIVALVLDGLDGRVARLTNTQSDFGAQYDSMADVVSFGVAPAILMYTWALAPLGKLGWVAAFVHMAGGALRLARFNVQLEVDDKRFFQGLPSPAAGGVLACFVWVSFEYAFGYNWLPYAILVLTAATGLLMVSNLRYYSFKDIDLRGKVPFVVACGVMFAFSIIFAQPPATLFLLFLGYALSGPIHTVLMIHKKRNARIDSE